MNISAETQIFSVLKLSAWIELLGYPPNLKSCNIE